MTEKDQNLIAALEAELESLPEENMFGDSNHLEHYPEVIKYLTCGDIPETFNEDDDENDEGFNDMLYKAIHDKDELYNDYEIK